MQNLDQSLEEVCAKEMLIGDSMPMCSQCGTKVGGLVFCSFMTLKNGKFVGESREVGMFQKTARNSGCQPNALFLQQGYHDQGKG